MKNFFPYRWKNLKNNWNNHNRIKDMFNSTCLDEIIGAFLLGMIISILISLFTGCTTLDHNPSCKCECREDGSLFECSGIVEHKELNLP